MTINDLINSNEFTVINPGEDLSKEVVTPYCCDLLSIVMGKAPSNCAWVTIMGNVNSLAVATLADMACIILADGIALDDMAKQKLATQNITVLGSELPIFDTALKVYQLING